MALITLSVFALAALAATRCAAVNVTVPSAGSNGTLLDPTLAAFSIELDRWPDWTGTLEQPNRYTQTVLKNVEARTGVAPAFRVGGNSEDNAVYDPQFQYVNATFPPKTTIRPWPEATNISIGRDFYLLSGNLLPGTDFTWGLNLKYRNATIAVQEAQALTQSFMKLRHVSLSLIEIGNEPDFYFTSAQSYADEWLLLANAVSKSVGLVKGKAPSLQGGAFAGTSISMVNLLKTGIATNGSGELLSTLSQHRYQGSFCQGSGGLIADLMNKDHIRGNLSKYEPDIAATNNAGFTYILGETNSYSCHGAPGLSNTAGAAVWGVDYTLQAAKLNITRVHFHNGIGYKYNFFQPIAGVGDDGVNKSSVPHIMPMYHVLLIVGEAVGRTGRSTIQELTINEANVSGYGIWEHGKLARIVLINSNLYLSTDSQTRSQATISLQGLPGHTRLQAKRFTVPSADATYGLTWGGQSFETISGLPSGRVASESVQAGNITISATEVVLLSLQ